MLRDGARPAAPARKLQLPGIGACGYFTLLYAIAPAVYPQKLCALLELFSSNAQLLSACYSNVVFSSVRGRRESSERMISCACVPFSFFFNVVRSRKRVLLYADTYDMIYSHERMISYACVSFFSQRNTLSKGVNSTTSLLYTGMIYTVLTFLTPLLMETLSAVES